MKNDRGPLPVRLVRATAVVVLVASTIIGCSDSASVEIGSSVVRWMPPSRTIVDHRGGGHVTCEGTTGKRIKRYVVNIPTRLRSNSLGRGGRKPDESKRVPSDFDEDQQDQDFIGHKSFSGYGNKGRIAAARAELKRRNWHYYE